jgi:hypothetical protein
MGNIFTGAQCPVSHPIRTQVDNNLICLSLSDFCLVNNSWYDESQNLYCPGVIDTTKSPSLSNSIINEEDSSAAQVQIRTVQTVQMLTISSELIASSSLRRSGSRHIISVRATAPGKRPVYIKQTVSRGKAATFPMKHNLQGRRITLFVDGRKIAVLQIRK